MITNITLENFKCFRRVSINPKRLTVLIGPNGTGKSSILQALLLLKQSVDGSSISPRGEFFNLRDAGELEANFASESTVRLIVEGKANGRRIRFSTPLHLSNFDGSVDEVEGALWELHPLLGSLKFVPAMRGLVLPVHRLGNRYEEHIPLDQGLDAYESQLATNLGYERRMEETLSALLKKITGTGLRAETVPPQSVEIKSLSPSGPVNMVWEGFGANALIQLLLQLITAKDGATVLIEEPEIHLHPKAQADLAEVLAETAKDEDKQIVMTTHSEYIAGRLLTLVAEGKLSPAELAIYSFEKDENGECRANELVVTERGQTEGGLTGFFDNNLAEMDRYIQALKNRT